MNRLVYTVFKTIAFAIIFVFVWDMVFYMYRTVSLNSRMESIATSLKKVVMENNYLPSETAEVYSDILTQMICDFNGVTWHDNMTNAELLASAGINSFIAGMHWNYGTDATGTLSSLSADRKVYINNTWTTRTKQLLVKDMSTPADYGDIMVVQIRVAVYQPMWGWSASPSTVYTSNRNADATDITGDYNYDGEDARYWDRNSRAKTTQFTYTYYVPCLNYKTITQ